MPVPFPCLLLHRRIIVEQEKGSLFHDTDSTGERRYNADACEEDKAER